MSSPGSEYISLHFLFTMSTYMSVCLCETYIYVSGSHAHGGHRSTSGDILQKDTVFLETLSLAETWSSLIWKGWLTSQL